MFQVTDANGCTYQELYTVADVIKFWLQQRQRLMKLVFGLDHGTATFTLVIL
jgi:hypothetical protein